MKKLIIHLNHIFMNPHYSQQVEEVKSQLEKHFRRGKIYKATVKAVKDGEVSFSIKYNKDTIKAKYRFNAYSFDPFRAFYKGQETVVILEGIFNPERKDEKTIRRELKVRPVESPTDTFISEYHIGSIVDGVIEEIRKRGKKETLLIVKVNDRNIFLHVHVAFYVNAQTSKNVRCKITGYHGKEKITARVI